MFKSLLQQCSRHSMVTHLETIQTASLTTRCKVESSKPSKAEKGSRATPVSTRRKKKQWNPVFAALRRPSIDPYSRNHPSKASKFPTDDHISLLASQDDQKLNPVLLAICKGTPDNTRRRPTVKRNPTLENALCKSVAPETPVKRGQPRWSKPKDDKENARKTSQPVPLKRKRSRFGRMPQNLVGRKVP